MKLSDWAEAQGVHYRTALRWYHDGVLPVPACRVGRSIMVGDMMSAPGDGNDGVVLYARVSSSDQKGDLDRQVARLSVWAARQGLAVTEVVAETGSGLNGKRRKLLKVLSDRRVGTVVVERRDRLARFGFEMVEAVLRAEGRCVLVVDDSEVEDDLVRDMTEVLTSMCARLYGKRSAADRAEKALQAISGG